MTVEARSCPRCNSPMVLRTAARGSYAGQQFWGCSTYPKCWAVVGAKEEIGDALLEASAPAVSPAGAPAQVEYERERRIGSAFGVSGPSGSA